jgi:mannose-1-phosphate guanylyltransferase/mannose-6-phosphate isomerase
MSKVIFTILCGGSGSRLWPKSREKLPKQLLKLTNDYTMLQNTILRIKKMENYLDIDIQIICNIDHYFIIEEQIKELKELNKDIIIITEPKGRDSAPAVCISSLLNDMNDYTFIIPSDHIFNDDEFVNCCNNSFDYLNNSIVTFGIKPNRIETGYGYIKIGDNNITEKFIEKPNYEVAKKYFEEGTYYWNAGIFGFKNLNMNTCFEENAPDILAACKKTLENSNLTKKIIHLSNLFLESRSISIDYAIMEKICSNKDLKNNINPITLPYNSYWNDIGSYEALYNELTQENNKNNTNNTNNTNKNYINGDIINLNSNNCYIDSENKLTAVIGVNNLVVVNTQDSLLICDKNKTQDIKLVVENLKKNNRIEYIFHKKVFRPWGWYINVEGDDYSGFKIKRIAVYPNKRLSLQSHNHRSEHWVIVKGNSKVQVGDNILLLNADQNVYIPIKTLHRIENIGEELLEFTETQIGNYLGEDDIIRYEDDFGRC